MYPLLCAGIVTTAHLGAVGGVCNGASLLARLLCSSGGPRGDNADPLLLLRHHFNRRWSCGSRHFVGNPQVTHFFSRAPLPSLGLEVLRG